MWSFIFKYEWFDRSKKEIDMKKVKQEGINNKTKVMKRNAYGFKRFDHFKAKILLNLKYKNVAGHVG